MKKQLYINIYYKIKINYYFYKIKPNTEITDTEYRIEASLISDDPNKPPNTKY